jgi:hypothetical protein
MARFFFHLLDDASVDYIEGRELPDVEAAREQAYRFAEDLAMHSTLEYRRLKPGHSVQVAGDGGVLFEVRLDDALASQRQFLSR